MSGRNSLWEVQTANATHYLLGSAHLLRESAYPLGVPIEMAYNSAEVLVVEADPSGVPGEELERLCLSRARYEGGKSLRGSVSGATYDLVRRRVAEIGADMGVVNKTKPFFLAMDFSNYVANSIGLSGAHGIDGFFLAKAKADRKEVIYLETLEEQLDLLACLPPEAQEKSLFDTLKSLDEVADRLERINRAWATGDAGALEAVMVEQDERCPEVNESLIYARNERWLPRVEKYLGSDRSHLVVVGATHLVGERGILRALNGKGYAVEQL